MGEEFQTGVCGGNYWWNNMNSTRSVFPLMSPSPCSVAANDSGGMGCRTWKSDDMVELKATTRSCADQETNMAFLDDGTILMDSNSTLQIIGFGLSSNWNNHSLSGKPAQSNFQEAGIDSSSNLPKSFSSSSSASTMDDLCGGFPSYGLTQSLYDPHPQPNSLFTNPSMGTATPNYGLHFSNWNASAEALNDMRAGVFPPSSQPQQYQTSTLLNHKPNFPTPLITKPKSEQAPDLASAVKKCVGEPAIKRQKLETPSPLPTFKVRKEKLGDRITALQQLVSPFGKTDTASVLHEAIEYIKFLHDQVSVLSTPYMKNNGAPIQQQQDTDLKELEGPKQDLRSRGLCLVPISSTFPVTNETTADFWTPSFGGALIR